MLSFLYEAVVVEVLAASPPSGPVAGGTPLVLSGHGFAGAAAGLPVVTFGGVAATAVVVEDDARLTCVAPAHAAGAVDVVVVNTDGVAGTLVAGFAFEAAPPVAALRFRTPSGAATPGLVRLLNPPPTIAQVLGQPATASFTTAQQPLGKSAIRFEAFGVVLFDGLVTGTVARSEGREKRAVWDATATGYEQVLGRRYPVGEWIGVAGDLVIRALMAEWGGGFSAAGVEAGLGPVSIFLDGDTDLWSAIGQVCDQCGAKAFVAATVLHVFTVDSHYDPPTAVTPGNPDLLYPENVQAVTVEYDYTQIRNRVTVRGAEGLKTTIDDAASIARYDVCEFPINDNTLTTLDELVRRAQVELAAYAQPIPTIHYATRDLKTAVGKTVAVAMATPTVSGNFVIQTVKIDQLNLIESGTRPRFAVTACPSRAPMRRAAGAVGLMQTVVDLAAAAKKQPRLDGDIVATPGGRVEIPPSSIPASKLAGCLGSELLAATGVEAGDYGDGAHLTTFAVNAQGQLVEAAVDPVPVAKVDGTQPFVADQSMGGNQLTNVGAPANPGDAATKAYVDGLVGTPPDLSAYVKRDGSTPFTGDQSMGAHKLTSVTNPSAPQDAATKAYVDAAVAAGGGGGASTRVAGETPAGAVNGVNAVFTTAAAYGATLEVYLNGLRQRKGTDYTETAATTFTFGAAPLAGDLVLVDYGAGSGGGGGAAGALVLLEQHSAAGGVAQLDFTAFLSATYDEYEFQFIGLQPATTGALLQARASTGGGVYDATAVYHYARHFHSSNGAASVGGDGSESATAFIMAGNLDAAASASCNGVLRLYNPQSASLHKAVDGAFTFLHQANGDRYRLAFAGWYLNAAALAAVRFFMSAGNIAAGVIRVYGVAKV